MRQINKIVKSYKHLVFLDFEGTQYSHEIIAIGATVASIKSNGHIKKYYASFKRYVKPKNPIGNFVTKLTGITEDKLKSDGIRFSVMLEDFKKYLGRKFKSSLFVTFGNYDWMYYTFKSTYVNAPFIPTADDVGKNDLDAFRQTFLENVKQDSNYIQFYVDAGSSFSESASNSTTQSPK